MSKKLCKEDRDQKKNKKQLSQKLKYVCKKCERTARKLKDLCKPIEFQTFKN